VTRFVPNNQISLLQNGEAYFPAIEAALDQAMHEIYMAQAGGLSWRKNPRADRWIRFEEFAENHGRLH
jgi:phosphatidylserine/phosphatidylglycerophosphate/cardiolipin synthase-like enzyme